MSSGTRYFPLKDCGESDGDPLLEESIEIRSPDKIDSKHSPRSPWTIECISRLLVLFVLSLVAIGFMIRFIPEKKGFMVAIGDDHDDHEHHEHNVFKRAAVAAGQLECSIVGKNILKAGGNAVDAAIATTLCQGVVEPYYSGIGGGAGMTIYNSTTKTVTCITSREKAPSAATRNMYLHANGSAAGAKFIAVPGELKGLWYAYKKYGGKVKWAELLKPAINKAKNGFKVSGSMADKLQALYKSFISTHLDSYFCELYCNENKTGVKKEGDLVKNPKLAETLMKIQKSGIDEFYSGSIAKMIVRDIQDLGGIITKNDLREYTVEENPAIEILLPNAGYKIHAPPLPYGGPVFGGILSIIDLFNVTPSVYDKNPTLQWHRVDEAFRHSYGARGKMGDPDKTKNANEIVKDIVSGKFAIKAKKKIFDNKTFHDPKYYGATFFNPGSSSTSHVSVLAPNKDAVSITSTINYHFGSKVISQSTGIVFNNEMDDFSYPTGNPSHDAMLNPSNQIEGGKRPLSSMSPVIFTDFVNKDPIFVIGAAGGKRIPSSVANVMLRLLYFTNDDFDDPIRALRLHDSLIPDYLEYEDGYSREIIDGLKKIGHHVKIMGGESHVNGIKYHESHIHAFSDLRNKGAGVSGW